MAVVSMNYLLEAGVHFGHQKRRWNPKMGEYIYTSRDDIYIIDLQKTVKKIEEAYVALKAIAERGGQVLFIGTKKQAQEAAEECALRSEMYFANERWLGGTLTNFKTIRQRIKRLDEIEKMEAEGTFSLLPKKEVIQIRKEYDKLHRNLRGIREMKRVPDALVIVDPRKEEIAIKEARILNIPIFGVVDTNCDPDMVDYVMPGNDDAVRSVKLMLGVITNAICEANGKEVVDYLTDEDKSNRANVEKPVKKEETVKEVKAEVEALVAEKTVVEPVVEAAPVVEEKAPVEAVEEVTVSEVSSNLSLAELKEQAKAKGIKGYSKMKKEELIAALN